MRIGISPNRLSTYTLEQHQEILRAAIESCDMNPYRITWHYLRAAMLKHGNVSRAADRLGLHRRTAQRILAKKEPSK